MTVTKSQAKTWSREFDELDRQIKELTKARDALKVKLLAFAKSHDNKVEAGDYTISAVASWRFDADKVAKAFPPAKFPQYYKLGVDPEALKADIPESKRKPLQNPSYTLYVTHND